MENEPYVLEPQEGCAHEQTIILLHGRDSIAMEFATEFFESETSDKRFLLDRFPTTRWVFPASGIRKSERFDRLISQWFDIWSVEDPSEKKEIQQDGLRESVKEILKLILDEASLVPPNRIILGGISQGCATAINALLCSGIRLGGFIGFCGWLAIREDVLVCRSECAALEQVPAIPVTRTTYITDSIFDTDYEALNVLGDLKRVASSEEAANIPIFLAHSEDDDVVPIRNGEEMRDRLMDLGFKVTWQAYEDGGHWINEPIGVDRIASFLKELE